MDEDHLLTVEQVQAHADASTEKAILIAAEVQTLMGMSLGPPKVMQASHYATDAPPDVWVDCSPGHPEIETDNPVTASIWLDLPNILRELRADIQGLKDNQVEIVETIKGLARPMD